MMVIAHMVAAFVVAQTQPSGKITWQHPAGMVTEQTIVEVREKIQSHEWAKRTWATRNKSLERWLAVSSEELRRIFPKKRGNVYHNLSCPTDRCTLTFDPFKNDEFTCPSCGKKYAPDTDPGVYGKGDRYHGTMYDGWACRFYQLACGVAMDLALVGRGEAGAYADKHFARAIEILSLYASTVEGIRTREDKDPAMRVILTYHREGDNKVLNELAVAYELLRDHMTSADRERFERAVLRRMLDDVMLEPIYRTDWNNVYQWHRTILQVALSLEREDLIDWVFGYGASDPEHQPEHRSVRRLAKTHFKPDGAFWEMCSGYHLYPVFFFCELAVVSRNLVWMDPKRFPADRYDLTNRGSEAGRVIHNSLEWFMSMAMPDRTMPTIGDSVAPRAGMDDYYTTAEVGYRFYGVKAVGDYEKLRKGQREWAALLYGASEIVKHDLPYASSCLSSGWVSLRNEWKGNRVWVGLNALIPGGGHQHADRLGLLTYSHGQLLLLEKATPYNEAVTRVLGTLSPSHNTVTVDKTSQKQGEDLKGDEIPRVTHFYAGPVVKFAELRGDRIYGQTKIYRRSVALIEDIIADVFQVEGGRTHDWVIHHSGTAPQLSMALEKGAFEPAQWIANGTGRVLSAKTDGSWDARWIVGGVTSRLSMLGSPGTEVYALETYPINNAFVTPTNPPCQTLCVRRGDDSSFVAVWDAWRDSPNLQVISAGSTPGSLIIRTATNTYHLLFGQREARFGDGLAMKSDGEFALFRDCDAAVLIGGTLLEVNSPAGDVRLVLDNPATASAKFADGVATLDLSGDIQYDTYGGQDYPRPVPAVRAKIDGKLWKVDKQQQR